MNRAGLGCCAAVMLAGGCTLAPKPGGGASTPTALPADGSVQYVNPFEPTRLHVHGLTELAIVNGAPRIDAHIELFDAFGQPVKALGSCIFQIYAGTSASGEQGQQLERWVVDLTDPATNAAAYDRVTRTYRVALTEAPSPESTRGYMLDVQFRSISGATISARYEL